MYGYYRDSYKVSLLLTSKTAICNHYNDKHNKSMPAENCTGSGQVVEQGLGDFSTDCKQY